MKLSESMCRLAYQAGGSHKTRSDRIAIAKRIAYHLRALNIQIKTVAQLKTKHIHSYIKDRLQQGISKRTLQNEMAAIRQILRQSDRTKLADSDLLSNKALGISNASRAGTKEAIPDELYQAVLQKAQLVDEGLAVALQLSRLSGLRSLEAVRCCKSLKTWRAQIKNGSPQLSIIYGTKGGRPRKTLIMNREALLPVVEDAIRIASKRKGRLIDKSDLEQAIAYWRNQTRRLGLIGKHSPHSLRYAWAQDAIRYYMEQGLSKEEAIAAVSMDLGHGDGRGRYIKRVYALE